MALMRNGHGDMVTDFRRLQDEINRLFDFDRLPDSLGVFDRSRATSPPMDVLEDENQYTVFCELPGVTMDDLELTMTGSVLTIKGEKRPYQMPENARLFKQEHWHGAFQRTLSLPNSVQADKVEAELREGILRIRLPKREEVKPRQIKIAATAK